MRSVVLAHEADAAGWREAARALLAEAVPPAEIVWQAGAMEPDLFGEPVSEARQPGTEGGGGGAEAGPGDGAGRVRVPRGFVELAERVACHRDPDRFALLYRVLWRLAHGEGSLLDRASDADVYRLHRLERAVSRECHKLHAFVRFRRVPGVAPERYVAWFEPEHHVLRRASGFFRRRFATMRWSILTPDVSAHWDTHELRFDRGGQPRGRASRGHPPQGDPPSGERAIGAERVRLPEEEPFEALWRTYFASTFNPARLRLEAMRSEMPVRYWKNLPEASLIAALVHAAGPRVTAMMPAGAPAPASPRKRGRRQDADTRPTAASEAGRAIPFREPVRAFGAKSRATVTVNSGSDPVASIHHRESS